MPWRRTSPAGLAFIREQEGVRLQPYEDSAGRLTIGVGHLLTPQELESGEILAGSQWVQWRNGITEEQADQILAGDLRATEDGVNLAIGNAQVTQNQFDALVSLAYNIGVNAFAHSTLCRLVVQGQMDEAAKAFSQWRYSGGNIVPGLVARREREAELFSGGSSVSTI
jgi:lysozyme